MATIVQILGRRWPGREWTIQADDYVTLIWGRKEPDGSVTNTNPESKPDEATIRAFSDDVDLELVAESTERARENALIVEAGAVFKGFDIIMDYLVQLHQALPAQVKAQIPETVVSRAQGMRNKLNQILSDIP